MLNNPFLKKAVTLIAGSAAAQGIALLAIPILSRLYSPDDFGVLAQYLSIVGIISSIMCLRFDDAVFATTSSRQLKAVITIGLFSALAFVVLFSVIGVGLHFGGVLHHSSFTFTPTLILMLVLGAALQAVYLLLSNGVVKSAEFGLLARTNAVRAISIVIFQIASAFTFSSRNMGLVYGDLVGKCFGIIPLFSALKRKLSSYRVSSGLLQSVWKRNVRFVKISTPNALINVSASQLPALLFVFIYDYKIAGIYLMAQRVVGAPLALFGRAIAQVYSSNLSDYCKQGTDKLLEKYKQMASTIFKWTFFPVLMIAVLAPYTIGMILGEKWTSAGLYITALSPMLLAQIVVTSLSNTANIIGKQDLLFKWDILRIVTVVSIFATAYVAELSDLQCISLFGIVVSIAFSIQYFMISGHLAKASHLKRESAG